MMNNPSVEEFANLLEELKKTDEEVFNYASNSLKILSDFAREKEKLKGAS